MRLRAVKKLGKIDIILALNINHCQRCGSELLE